MQLTVGDVLRVAFQQQAAELAVDRREAGEGRRGRRRIQLGNIQRHQVAVQLPVAPGCAQEQQGAYGQRRRKEEKDHCRVPPLSGTGGGRPKA